MVDVVSLIKKGYFPRELPPPFTTETYGVLVDSKRTAFPKEYSGATKPATVSHKAVHNLARVGALRRKLSIPNPINFLQLAQQIEADWTSLEAHCKASKFSLSTPVLTNTVGRAIGRKCPFDELPSHRARIKATSKYTLSTDISSFYPTIYTHSIPWALNGKSLAKASKTSAALMGNEIDRFSRNGQEGQTIGIPIGPDTSLVIAEVILSAVDKAFFQMSDAKGFRYMDDFEFGFNTYAEAEQALAKLQGILNDYELQLNPNKTQIIDWPEPIESAWVSELRVFPFRSRDKSQRFDLIRYFNRAFELTQSFPTEHVLKYAVSRLNSERIDKQNWELFQHLLLQCATLEPGTLPFCLEQLKYYVDNGYALDMDTLSAALSNIIFNHGPLGHGSEVAWALWGAVLFGINLHPSAVSKLSNIEDSIVALLALDANSLGLLGFGFSSSLWEGLMTEDELFGDQWLLAYEANAQGWLTGTGGKNNVDTVPAFKFLKDEGVKFYDKNCQINYKAKKSLLVYLSPGGVVMSV